MSYQKDVCQKATPTELVAELLNRTGNFDPPFNPKFADCSSNEIAGELSTRLEKLERLEKETT